MAMNFLDVNLIDEDGTFTFTSADTSLAEYLYDRNRNTQLQSSGSDDVTDEIWDIEFTGSTPITRIHIGNHNIKAGKIEYWNGAAWTDFSSAIAYSGETDTSHYHEFDSVSTTKIRLTMNTTQTVDAEKVVGQLIATTEIGEVATNPSRFDFGFKEIGVKHTASDGRVVNVTHRTDAFEADLVFSDASTADMTLFRTLKDRKQPFYLFPCGGVSTYTQEGFRIRDLYWVTITNDFKPKLKGNLLDIGTVYAMEVSQA